MQRKGRSSEIKTLEVPTGLINSIMQHKSFLIFQQGTVEVLSAGYFKK
jgi:hypothetical protein